MTVWLVQAWWYRDVSSSIIGIYANRKAAQAEVDRRTRRETIWSYGIQRFKIRDK